MGSTNYHWQKDNQIETKYQQEIHWMVDIPIPQSYLLHQIYIKRNQDFDDQGQKGCSWQNYSKDREREKTKEGKETKKGKERKEAKERKDRKETKEGKEGE